MEEKVVDRRVRKTKRQLRLALMKLMAEKSVKDISVRELAAIADINRGTFYIHYKDVYDLLSSLEDELADGLVVVCRRHNAKDSEGKTYPYLMELYQYIEQNSDLCHVLLGKNGDIAFTDRICHILRDEFLYDFLAYYYPNDPEMLDYFCSFIVSGNMSLALTWIDNGMKQTPEEMAVLAGEIIMVGGYYLYAALLLGKSFAGAAASVPGNLVQGAFGLVCGVVIIKIIAKTRVLNKFSTYAVQ